MKAGKKDKKRRVSAKGKNASPVCYSNSSELRPEYKDDEKKEDAIARKT